jgi:hypothetical protein
VNDFDPVDRWCALVLGTTFLERGEQPRVDQLAQDLLSRSPGR